MKTTIPIVCALFLLMQALAGCKRAGNAFAPPPPPAVTVAHPIQRSVTRYLESTGTTEGFESVELRARVPGFLDQVRFKPGAPVKKGDLLFVIDKRTYQAAVDSAAAALAQAEAELAWARVDFKRVEGLKAESVASQLEWDQRKRDVQVGDAKVAAGKAALDRAKLDLEFCDVRAPIDGRITKNFVDVGNLVGAAGQPTVLATMVRAKPIYVPLDASEADLVLVRRQRMATSPDAQPGEVSPGVRRPVWLATAGQDGYPVRGIIDYVDPALNPATGTIRVRCRFENEDEQLLPGMFVRLRVLLEEAPAVLAPDIALPSDQSGRYALLVNDKNAVEVRRIKIGALDGDMRVVVSGLAPTDRVIVNGLQRARPGAVVNPSVIDLARRGLDTRVASASR